MTDQNNAAKAAIRDWDNAVACAQHAPTTGMVMLESSTVLEVATLLSKLRATVVNEPPGGTRWPVLRAMARNYTAGKHTWDALDAEACEQAAEEIRHLRAALASAPVAGELPHWEEVSAKLERDETLTPLEFFIYENEPAGGDGADAWRDQLAAALASAPVAGEAPTDAEIIDMAVEPLGIDYDRMPYGIVKFARALLAQYAAPQASEAVRDALAELVRLQDAKASQAYLPNPQRSNEWAEYRRLWPAALEKARAALSAQPGAQRTGGSDA